MKSILFYFDFPLYIIANADGEPLFVEVDILKWLAEGIKCFISYSDQELAESYIREAATVPTLKYIEINEIDEYCRFLLEAKKTAQYINYNTMLQPEYLRYFSIDDELDKLNWFVCKKRDE